MFGFNRPSKSCECKDECDSIIGPLNEIKIICGVFVVGVSPGVDDVWQRQSGNLHLFGSQFVSAKTGMKMSDCYYWYQSWKLMWKVFFKK